MRDLKISYLFIFGIILFILSACSPEKAVNKEVIEGDLFFKLVDPQFFQLPDSVLITLENQCIEDSLLGGNSKFNEDLCFLVNNDLLRKPYKHIRSDKGKINVIFLSKNDFAQLDKFNLQDLQNEYKRIRIKASVIPVKLNDTVFAYKVIDLIATQKIDGETFSKK